MLLLLRIWHPNRAKPKLGRLTFAGKPQWQAAFHFAGKPEIGKLAGRPFIAHKLMGKPPFNVNLRVGRPLDQHPQARQHFTQQPKGFAD